MSTKKPAGWIGFGLQSWLLGGCALVSAGGYVFLARLQAGNVAGDVWAMIAVLLALFVLMAAAWRCASRFTRLQLWMLLGFGGLFRLLILPAGVGAGQVGEQLVDDLASRKVSYERLLLYDNDLWRYFWDGHVAASGFSPYASTPYELLEGDAEEVLLEEELWSDVVDNVSYQRYRTVYPPLAQHLFRLHHAIAPASVVLFKLFLLFFDGLAILALLKLLDILNRPREDILFYAWNPLVIKEFGGSAHLDGVMIALLLVAFWALARERYRWCLVAWVSSIMAKLVPVALGGLIVLRIPWRFWWWGGATFALIAWPFLPDLLPMLEGLSVFAREWEFNSGPWNALRWLLSSLGIVEASSTAHSVARFFLVGWVLWATYRAWRLRDSVRSFEALAMAAFLILAAILLASPAVMPWYLPWALPFAILVGCRSWLVLMAASLLSYLFYIDQEQMVWWLWCEYLIFGAALIMELRQKDGLFVRRFQAFRKGEAEPGRTG